MDPPNPPSTPISAAGFMPGDILLVEDNYIIAIDLEDMLREIGVAQVRSANSVHLALELIAAQTPDFAFIDINLGTEKGFSVAERLRALGVPFTFSTGYDDKYDFPDHLADVQIFSKPYTIQAVRAAILLPFAPPAAS